MVVAKIVLVMAINLNDTKVYSHESERWRTEERGN